MTGRHNRRLAWVIGCGLVLVLVAGIWRSRAPMAGRASGTSHRDALLDDLARRFIEKEARADEEVEAHFPTEVATAPFRDALVEWWDAWNREPEAWVERMSGIGRLTWLRGAAPRSEALGGALLPAVPAFDWDGRMFLDRLRRWKAEGWRVERTRWHLERWQAGAGDMAGGRAGVRFEVLARKIGPTPARATLGGLAWVDATRWMSAEGGEGTRGAVELEALEVGERDGPPGFEVAADIGIPVPPHTPFCDPLLAWDGPDGPALALVGAGVLMRWREGEWRSEGLPGLPPERIWAAAVGDWNRDGMADLWLAGSDGLRVLPGPRWAGPGVVLWKSPQRMPHPQALAVADVDGDGDDDAFVGQYKMPYQGGQFPTPWHDAADGFPSVLLRNDGPAGWSDVTAASGLGMKARRRIYSASFSDWDADGKPDLVMASDFAGLDVLRNVGGGRFMDLTAALGTNRLGFGMGHWTGDINGDGRTDVLLVGMDSPVADRLSWTRQRHTGWPEDALLRSGMTVGNRWLTWDGTRFAPMPGAGTMARGGWAWAASVLDADNDGWPEVHLANGHETLSSARDYEEVFWTRDLHAAGSVHDPLADAFFRAAAGRRAAGEVSYGGWQHGAWFENLGGQGWRESGWLAGTSILADQRNAVALDFDRDGRMDLAVTTMELWPVRRQRLVVLANRMPQVGHWVGLRFVDGPGTGVIVRLKAGGRVQERRITAGESHRSQSAGSVHFGLGEAREVEWLEVREPGAAGWQRAPVPPAVDRWQEWRLREAAR